MPKESLRQKKHRTDTRGPWGQRDENTGCTLNMVPAIVGGPGVGQSSSKMVVPVAEGWRSSPG